MRKGIFVIAAFSVFLMSCPVQAAIKFDVAATAGKITETVSGWLETAKKKMDESETLQTPMRYCNMNLGPCGVGSTPALRAGTRPAPTGKTAGDPLTRASFPPGARAPGGNTPRSPPWWKSR